MDRDRAQAIIDRVQEKRAENSFSTAVQQMANQQLKTDGLRDVGNLALASLGIGAAGRGAVGLFNLLKPEHKTKTRSGPTELPLPYPIERDKPQETFEIKRGGFLDRIAGGLGGNMATTKAGLPWYGPAVMMGSMGALGAGWKGMDVMLDHRREAERQKALESARSEFHDALLAQYDKPIDSVPHPKVLKKAAADAGKPVEQATTMEKVGAELDALYDDFVKLSIDFGNIGGAMAGGYGMYAGLAGLGAGALVYDSTKKRSRQAVIDKALKRRERRNFMQQPPPIYARPEPVEQLPEMPENEDPFATEN